MTKLFILKLLDPIPDGRFPAILQYGKDGEHLDNEFVGYLPEFPVIEELQLILPQLFYQWQDAFSHKVDPYRPRKIEKRKKQQLSSSHLDCKQLADKLKKELDNWLNSDDPDWKDIRDTLIEKVTPNDRVIIQTDNSELRKLPLSIWDVFQKKNLEISISKIGYQKIESQSQKRNKQKILVILGDSERIDTESDETQIQRLKNQRKSVKTLKQPTRQEFFEILKEDWQIIFYSGHSESDDNGNIGWIHINKQDKIEISEFKETIKQAITKGLKLFIFNSCDGLGLAYQLAELNLPQSIVMREEIPDLVAQDFLKYFLENYKKGKSLCASVLQAKTGLEYWEKDYPGVSWLPVIWQNPGVIPPPSET
jgi:hypothetical protein